MTWKCPEDGYDNEDTSTACGSCGYSRMARRLVLTSSATGQQKGMSISTQVGKGALLSFAGDEARYASDPQFEVIKDTGRGLWAIKHHPSATNPTFYNGTALGAEEKTLEKEGVITIGPEKMKLVVTLEI